MATDIMPVGIWRRLPGERKPFRGTGLGTPVWRVSRDQLVSGAVPVRTRLLIRSGCRSSTLAWARAIIRDKGEVDPGFHLAQTPDGAVPEAEAPIETAVDALQRRTLSDSSVAR